MAGMTDAEAIVAFWNARLDEDGATAKAAAEASAAAWRAEPNVGEDWWAVMYTGPSTIRPYDEFDYPVAERVDRADVAHIARHDPARVLREIEAKRAILAMHHRLTPHPEYGFTYPAAGKFCGYCGPGDNWQAEQEPDHYPFALWPCRHVRILTAIWSDHPDYREQWKP